MFTYTGSYSRLPFVGRASWKQWPCRILRSLTVHEDDAILDRTSFRRERMKWASIELLVLDVDGVLTDGRILSSTEGGWNKSFYVQDGCAIKLWSRMGGNVAIISGRNESAVDRRAAELGIQTVHKGVSDKTAALDAILSSSGIGVQGVAYMGDDIPDLDPMSHVSFPVAVANAHPAVKRSAMYVTRREGGRGAVAEVVEFLLRKQKRWSAALRTAMSGDHES